MNVMLINPSSLSGESSEVGYKSKSTTPNMGLIYIATYLKSKTNAKVLLLDMTIDDLDYQKTTSIIRDFRPVIVGISSKTFTILSTYQLAGIVKSINSKTIVLAGGAHPTALPKYTLNECRDIDAIIIREGEHTMVDIYNRVKKGYNIPDDIFTDIEGIVWTNKFGETIINKNRLFLQDLDSLPFPDMSLVDYRKYLRDYNPNKHRFQHVYPVFGSRGCPFTCVFCTPLHTRNYRVRSVDNILDEIELLNKKYNAEWVYFEDSLFCTKKAWFADFCNKFMERGLHKKIQWGFETRIDTSDIEMFRQAKEASCIYTFFGVESGSEHILRKAKKNYSRGEIFEKVTAAKQAGIDAVSISIILGLPYETKETIEETLKLLEDLPSDREAINILDLYPGTEVFEMSDRGEGGLRWIEGKRMNWAAYSMGEVMAEVNDLTASDISATQVKALKLLAKKARKNKLELYRKRIIYAIELFRNDRPKLWGLLKSTIKGMK